MFCSKCGATLAQDNKFCTRCGAAANAAPPIIPVKPTTPAPAPKEKNNRTLMIILTAALAVLLICVIALTAVLLAGRNSPDRLWQEQYDLGNRYLSEGNYEEAVVAFCAAIDIDPKRPEAYRGAADAYIALGDYDSAADILRRGAEETGDEAMKTEAEQLKEPIPSAPEENTQSAEKRLTAIMRYDNNADLQLEYRFSYNPQGYISEIRYVYPGGESDIVYHLTYDQEGRLLLCCTGDPDDPSNYFYEEYTYNDAGQLISFVVKEGSISEEIFEYDGQELPVRSVVNNDFYENITEYTHNEQGLLTHKIITHYIPDGLWSEEYYYEYDEQGRIAMEIYQQAPYERISLYEYGYKDFVLIQTDDGYGHLVLQDIMGHEVFSISLLSPQFSADTDGYLSKVMNQDYDNTQFSYEFIYDGNSPQPEPAPAAVDAAPLYTEFLLAGGYDEIIGYEGITSANMDVRSCLVDFDEDGIEELLIGLYLTEYEYYTGLLDIRDGAVFVAATAFESGGTMGGDSLCFKYEKQTGTHVLAKNYAWRDGMFAGTSGTTVYAKHTYEEAQDIASNYYNTQTEPYGNIYGEMAADVKRETSHYTQDGADFYFYTINDDYVSHEAYLAASSGYDYAQDAAYQLQDASYYTPVVN